MASPVFSIVIPTHGRKEELKYCLQNILKQKYKNYEIIVVNAKAGFSLDDVRQLFPKVNYIEPNINLGASSARNLGAKSAQGEFLVFFDDDCEFKEEDIFEKSLQYFQDEQSLGAISFTMLDPLGEKEDKKLIPRWDRKSISYDHYVSFFIAGGAVIKKDLFFEVGEFWALLDPYFGQDTEFGYRLIDKGYNILKSKSINVRHKTSNKRFLGNRTLQRVLYGTAHVPLMAIRDLSLISVFSLTFFSWSFFFLQSALSLRVDLFLRGVIIALSGMKEAFKMRKPISLKAQCRIFQLRGRLFF